MTSKSYAVDSWTTRHVTSRERADFWSEHVTSYQGRMGFAYRRTDDFHAGTIRQRTDTYQLVNFWSDTITYTRSPHQVRHHPDEDYRLLLPVAGELLLRQGGQELRLLPEAGCCLVSFAAPFEVLQRGPAQALLLSIPAREVNGRLHRSSPCGLYVDRACGLGRVVGDMLTGLHEERDSLTGAQFDAVSDRLVELLCLLFAGDRYSTAPGHLAEVAATVRRYVRAHAGEPELTGTAVARALGWSLRQVQLALRDAGTTPRELIREERLRLVRDRLRAPEYRDVSITDLAYASGFSSASACSTAFKERFGARPSDVRRAAGPAGDGPPVAGPPTGGPPADGFREGRTAGVGDDDLNCVYP